MEKEHEDEDVGDGTRRRDADEGTRTKGRGQRGEALGRALERPYT